MSQPPVPRRLTTLPCPAVARYADIMYPHLRVACDSLVALPNATANRRTLFAKNSDRPALEPQPLCDVPAWDHPAPALLRCTYVEIPQVERTFRVIGSRPYWCWGFEHGVNEHGVAIGNHTVFSKDEIVGVGLIGMDLVRLGLERSRHADEAVAVITALLEEHGQGGSGYADKQWPYHNSFLIADPAGARLLETSGRHWVLRRVEDVGSLSNHLSIGSDWDALSDGAIEYSIEKGWWDEGTDARFDFAATYRDTTFAPEVVSSGRHLRTCTLLEAEKGRITPAILRHALRDHYGRSVPGEGLTPEDAEYFSVCMHADPVGVTTASVVAELNAGPQEPLLCWVGQGSPCVGTFLPLYLDTEVPPFLTRGSESETADSYWWRCKRLLSLVEANWAERLPRVRDVFDPFEAATAEAVAKLGAAPVAERQAFIDYCASAAAMRIEDLIRRLA